MSLSVGAALVFEGELPWQLLPLAEEPFPTKIATVNDSNELLLQNVLMSDEKREKHEYDENDAILLEFKKQDIKLRLILELLGALLVKNEMMPSAKRLSFSSSELSIPLSEDSNYQVGNMYECSIFLDAALPRPFVFYAVATEIKKAGWQNFEIYELRQSVQDSLEKYIFRYHRKTVAQSRKTNSTKDS